MKVRPITVMAGLAALVAVAAVTVAWLPDDRGATVGQPSSLPIRSGYGTASAMAPISSPAGSTTYVRGPGLVDLSTTQVAWTFAQPTTTAPPSATGSLARFLGVVGAVKAVDGGWQVGPDAGPVLRVSSTPGFNWSYASAMTSGGVACSSVSSNAADGSGSTPSMTAPWMTTTPVSPANPTTVPPPAATTAPPSPCEMPEPPAGVPDRSTAEALARGVLRAARLDPSKLEWHTTADVWTAMATATPVLDGTPTVGIDTTISFGGLAAIDSASGWLGTPTRAQTYPLIGIDAAIDRLNRGVDLLGPQRMGASEPANGMATQIAPGDPAAPPPTMVPEPTRVMPPTTVPDPRDSPIVPTPAPVDRAVAITSSMVVLVALPGQDGTTWLVPAYELRSGGDAAGRWLVLGVDESFIAPSGPSDKPVLSGPGMPGMPGSKGSAPTVETIPGSIKRCPPTDPNAASNCPTEGIDGPPTTGTTQLP